MQSATLPFAAPPSGAPAGAGWAALDEAAEWHAFGRPVAAEPGLWESYLAIEGMYCPGCTLTVEDALARCAGVRSVQVNGATATARITWAPAQGRPSGWFAALQKVGYGGLPAADLLTAAPRSQARRVLLWRWLVAGFCMMQVMMYAFPAYVAGPGEMTADVESLLRWASWILTLPVLAFSCWPFFQSALRDLRALRLGMDVPVALGILITFAASTAATFEPQGPFGHEAWFDSLTMFVFFLLSGRLLEQRLRDRTAGSLESLLRRLPQTIERECAPESYERVAVGRLAMGDRIRVFAGETFPADGVVLQGSSRVDEALLTGESRALPRGQGEHVVAGSHNLTGTLLVRVERVGAQTRYAEIVDLMERASSEKPRLAGLADRIAGPFLACVLMAATGAAVWWWPTGPSHALGIAVAVLIVTCPCALSLATPAATLAAAGALARRGVLVRRLGALEDCAEIDTVVFDKTGTLTDTKMSIVQVRTRSGTGAEEALALAGALAAHSLHPASRAIAAEARTCGWTARDVTEAAGQGLKGHVSGDGGWAPRDLRLGSATFCGAPGVRREGATQVHLADDKGWIASFDLDESMRADARTAIGALRRMGPRVELLSGDHANAVQRLAWRAGIEWSWGEQSPEDKLDHVCELQRSGARVAMVGDGMNDGPVLARANVSVAMGQAVPLAQAKADFVVLGSQLAAVSSLLMHARRTRTVVRQNLAWAAAYNAVCVPLALVGWMPAWLAGIGMAASSLLVVLNSARLARVRGDF
ncbi:cation-translocating P-type ATPase [Ramlibacter sp. WS9]|uniref:heavy metal translocating P-type ATPase n=1 Tax=Ramlibacter sp. WS9 TaxID=1882741 RepID=UPI001142FFEE|nr:cation-translocating P-type ATPase [Ramlibacter sp. WS9]ROZ75433.1 cation-translocating P-type ATPase [Ramlibacter sp. WS9]